jgi:hypothetical protein
LEQPHRLTLSNSTDVASGMWLGARIAALARIIHEYRREAAETEAWRGFSQVRATQADLRSVAETEREKPRQAMGSAAVAGIQELSGLGCAIVRYAHPVDYQASYATSQESVPPVCVERPR